MDPLSQAKLDRLLAIDKGSLTETDKSFLRARKTYIPNAKQKELRDILGGSDPVVESVEEVKREDWSEHPVDTEEQTDSVTKGAVEETDELPEDQGTIIEDEEDDEAEG